MSKHIKQQMADSPCRNCEACGKVCANSAYRTCPPFRLWFEERWENIQIAANIMRNRRRRSE